MTRVVVTGICPITSIGFGKEEFMKSLREGKDGISTVNEPGFPDNFKAGKIKDFDSKLYDISPKSSKRLALFSQYAVAGTKLALDDAGLLDNNGLKLVENINPYDILVRLGVGMMGLGTIEEQKMRLTEKGLERVSPLTVPMSMPNAAAANVSIYFGTLNEAVTVNSACSSSLTAIIDAYDKIKAGRCKVAVTGGVESCITPLAAASFLNLKALSPGHISRPYDKERDGFVMGEGAGIIVLENLEHALQRNAKIYAEILGYGATSDSFNIVAPDSKGEGLIHAINLAIEKSGIEKKQIDYINSHGTSTPLNDKIETLALKEALGDIAYEIPISSTKSMIGHGLGAAAGIETIASVLSIKHNFIHPTINYKTFDPECDLDYTPNKAKEKHVDIVLKTSLGFGGHNAAMILGRYHEKKI